jgi:hypothetical protein
MCKFGPFEVVNALILIKLNIYEVHQIDEVYLMAALLSATAENPAFAWDLNMNSLFRFEFGESRKIKKYSWPRVLPFLTNNS